MVSRVCASHFAVPFNTLNWNYIPKRRLCYDRFHKMKVKIPLLLSLLILGSLSVSGLREQPSDELARESVFIARYKHNDKFWLYSSTYDSDYRCDATLPIKTDCLNVTVIRHKEVKLYDIHVTWDRPCPLQFHCIVELGSIDTKINASLMTFHNHFESATEAMFRGVRISDQLNVSIRACSLLGEDPEAPKSFTVSNETVDQSESDTIISPMAMACMSLMLATGVCSYLAHISV